VYLDGGIKGCEKVFLKVFVPQLEGLDGDFWADNPKGKLQEYCQAQWKRSPVYRVTRRAGPAHAAKFTVYVRSGNGMRGRGEGRSKQEAEKRAAIDLLSRLAVRAAKDPAT
jgi:ribonuclease-3